MEPKASYIADKNSPQLWLLAGGNGAGKSTFFELFLRPHGVHFINADLIARTIAPEEPEKASYEAARLAEKLRYELLDESLDFCFETVYSHPSKIDFVADAKARGYEIILVFIHLENVALNLARISQRVSSGGHNVPTKKVIDRIPRTLDAIEKTLPLVDEFYLLDNSSAENSFQKVAVIKKQRLEYIEKDIPTWANQLIRNYIK